MESSSNNNWLTLLRRKIHKKFKRNRQKSNNNNVEEIVVENQIPETTAAEEVNQPSEPVTAEQNVEETANQSSSHNCEDMKKELSKLNWYHPNLR